MGGYSINVAKKTATVGAENTLLGASYKKIRITLAAFVSNVDAIFQTWSIIYPSHMFNKTTKQ
jgi:hypothetical protein